jgi:hypothetical protein
LLQERKIAARVTAVVALLVVALLFAGTGGSALATLVAKTPTPGGAAPSTATDEVTTTLPPPDIPTTNQQGYTFDLKTSLKVDLESVAKESPVYKLNKTTPTAKSAQKIVDALKINAKVDDRGDGSFQASGDGGQVFVSADVTQYFSSAKIADGKLSKDDDAISQAREFLRTSGLLPTDIGDAKVASRSDDTKRLIVQFAPATPDNVLSATPSITVTEGPGGQILEASIRWAHVTRVDVYQLMPAKQAWQVIQSGTAYIETDLSSTKIAPGSVVQGRATYNSVTVAYASSGAQGSAQFLQPIYVFSGTLTVQDQTGTYPIKAYVAALSNSGAPVG